MTDVFTPLDLGMVKAFAIQGRKTVLIDTGMPEHRVVLCQRLREKGIPPEDISLVIITHGHPDHFGNARFFQESVGARVLSHEADTTALQRGFSDFPAAFNVVGGAVSLFFRLIRWWKEVGKPPEPAPGVVPDLVITGEYDLGTHGIDGVIFPTPGHTPGSISVRLASGDVVVGDLIGSLVKPDRPSLPLWGHDLPLLRQSIRRVLSRQPRMIHASHFRPFSPEECRQAFPRWKREDR